MSVIHRQLIALDMLAQDLADELDSAEIQESRRVSNQYLVYLKHYLNASTSIAQQLAELSEYEFSGIITKYNDNSHLVSKNMLLVQNRLVSFALDYYDASRKLDEIRDIDFSERAEVRFDLLTTKAIKHKSQYRTVATAMEQSEYSKLIDAIGLPEFDWGWDCL